MQEELRRSDDSAPDHGVVEAQDIDGCGRVAENARGDVRAAIPLEARDAAPGVLLDRLAPHDDVGAGDIFPTYESNDRRPLYREYVVGHHVHALAPPAPDQKFFQGRRTGGDLLCDNPVGSSQVEPPHTVPATVRESPELEKIHAAEIEGPPTVNDLPRTSLLPLGKLEGTDRLVAVKPVQQVVGKARERRLEDRVGHTVGNLEVL
jgi:hypothetical protein